MHLTRPSNDSLSVMWKSGPIYPEEWTADLLYRWPGNSIPRLMTFTGGFDLTNVDGIEQGYDEREIAERLSYLLQTEHYAVVLHAGDMPAAMEKITWHVDDPRVGMCHQNWYVAKLASKFVKVCLAGAGGDELFAGYPWRYRNGISARNFDEFDRLYYRYWHRLLAPEELIYLFDSDLRPFYHNTWDSFQSVTQSAPDWQNNLTLPTIFFNARCISSSKLFYRDF